MNSSEIRKLAESNFDFIMEMCKQSDVAAKKNLLISPFSIGSALSMVYAGARNKTAKEMKKVLKINHTPEDSALHSAFQDTLNTLHSQQSQGVSLHSANKVYVQDGFKISTDYMNTVEKYYQSTVSLMDFSKESEKAREDINGWVEDVTQQKIKDLLPSGSVDSLTRLILVNALYFKGNWAKPFDKNDTQQHDFHVSSSKTIKVDMMFDKDDYKFGYDENLKCTILELPYTNENLSMIILLPNELDGLDELAVKLNYSTLLKLVDSLYKREIYLNVPRFRLECDLSLKDVLSTMGMNSLFSQTDADLSGMCSSQQLHVSAAVHKTFVEVNEEGTEAAAATAFGIQLLCLPPTIKVDHPFIFLIQEKSTGIILFFGKMVDPTL